ncbi:N-acetylmuramoyl-L-alanine amidase [Novosphingobium tardum]|uniref:N-acetylmuramoyl-L-alanine amidase n=1 Tax=Novosphingobium tardum TaxID=1538021 RepID=A0ABV8RM89_9SPHN
MDELVTRENLSPNCNDRALPVSLVVLHYTGMPTAAEAEARLCDPTAGVSAHYLIEEDGTVVRLVPEDKRAWHAGKSFWRGLNDINSASIGIELVNPGHEWGYRPFPDAQMEALVPLLARIVRVHDIAPANVVGHSDVAPARKDDPGELFDWPLLGRLGLALETPAARLDPLWTDAAFLLALERFGYDVTEGRAAVRAFQRRFRPAKLDGEIDGEIRAILFALLLDRDEGRAR